MAGIKKLRKIQMGRETTAGAEVNATTIWRGLGVPEDLQDTQFVEEDVGYLSGVDRVVIPSVLAGLSMEATPATFEQLPHILEAGVKTATPAQDGTGSGYIYTYTFPTTTQPTLKTYTLEAGDDQQEEQFTYGFVESFKLSGKSKEPVMMSAEWRGRQLEIGTYTGSLSLVTVEELLFGKSLLYIDPTTMGTTLKSNTLLAFDLDVKTGVTPVFAGDGQLYFSFTKTVMPEVVLNITYEHDSTSVAEKAAWRAKTMRLIRLKITGSTFTTAGSAYPAKTVLIDLAGKWEKFDKIGEQDGNDVVQGTFRARYDTTAAKFAEIVVVTNLSALP